MDETAKDNLIDLLVAIQNNDGEREVENKINVIKDRGDSINEIDDIYGETPLTTALSQFAGEKHNRLPIIKKLIEEGADVNKPNDDEETPLLLAVYSKEPDYVKILLENGADGPNDYILGEAFRHAKNIHTMLTVPEVPASEMPEEFGMPATSMVAAVAAPPVAPLLRRKSSSSSSDGEGENKKRKKSKSKSKKAKQKKKTKKLKKPKKTQKTQKIY